MITQIVNFLEALPWIKFGYAIAVFIIFFIIRKLFSRYILKLILNFTTKTQSNIDDQVIRAFSKPISVFIIILGVYFAIKILYPNIHTQFLVGKLMKSLIIILLGWGLFNLTEATEELFTKVGRHLNIKFDQIIIPFISKVLKFVIVALIITIVASEWGYNINGLITGLGLGGLAVALAAKDSLSNLFGGVVIITETPFTIGDWIKTPSVEGTVEDITFRSTKIRTFAQAIVTVPNSTLANEAITNWSKMGKRQITFNLKLNIHTPREKIVACTNDISDMLTKHDGIDPSTIFVNFTDFSTSSLDLFLYFFTKTTNWEEWLKIKEDCNLKIMKILEDNDVEIALPTQHLYYKNDSLPILDNNEETTTVRDHE